MMKMKKITIFRLVTVIVGFFGIFFGPPWLTLVSMAVLAFRFPAVEVIIMGVLMDFLWLPATGIPLFTIASIIFLWGLEPVRKELLVR